MIFNTFSLLYIKSIDNYIEIYSIFVCTFYFIILKV